MSSVSSYEFRSKNGGIRTHGVSKCVEQAWAQHKGVVERIMRCVMRFERSFLIGEQNYEESGLISEVWRGMMQLSLPTHELGATSRLVGKEQLWRFEIVLRKGV